jgi:hypothetical protein
MRAGRRSAPLDASTMLAAALVREDGERGSILTRTGNGKLPSSDLGNRKRITGTGCANLYDLARDDLTNRIAAILQVEQAQSTDIGKVEYFPLCRL